jgi:hypothetical protein
MEGITLDPGNTIAASDQKLQLTVGDPGRLAELRIPLRRASFGRKQTRGGRPAGQRHIRRCIRRDVFRVHRDVEATTLQLSSRGQANDAAAHHRDRPYISTHCEIRRHLPGAPGEGHTGATMPVVVDQHLFSEALRTEDEAGAAIWPEPNRGSDHARPSSVHGGEAPGRADSADTIRPRATPEGR